MLVVNYCNILGGTAVMWNHFKRVTLWLLNACLHSTTQWLTGWCIHCQLMLEDHYLKVRFPHFYLCESLDWWFLRWMEQSQPQKWLSGVAKQGTILRECHTWVWNKLWYFKMLLEILSMQCIFLAHLLLDWNALIHLYIILNDLRIAFLLLLWFLTVEWFGRLGWKRRGGGTVNETSCVAAYCSCMLIRYWLYLTGKLKCSIL